MLQGLNLRLAYKFSLKMYQNILLFIRNQSWIFKKRVQLLPKPQLVMPVLILILLTYIADIPSMVEL